MKTTRICAAVILCQLTYHFYLLHIGVDGGFLRFKLKDTLLYGSYDFVILAYGGAAFFLVMLNALFRPQKNAPQITLCGIVLLGIYVYYIIVTHSIDYVVYALTILTPYFVPVLASLESGKAFADCATSDRNVTEEPAQAPSAAHKS